MYINTDLWSVTKPLLIATTTSTHLWVREENSPPSWADFVKFIKTYSAATGNHSLIANVIFASSNLLSLSCQIWPAIKAKYVFVYVEEVNFNRITFGEKNLRQNVA